MKFSLCTISFRHQLISFADMVDFARRHDFDGIELWGIHAQHLYDGDREKAEEQLRILTNHDMQVSMLSDYLDISSHQPFSKTLDKGKRLISLAKWLGVNRIRTFAGQKASAEVSASERTLYVKYLRELCELCGENGMELLLETHPNTLTDNLASTLTLLEEINHPAVAINLDFLHIWESGADPIDSFENLQPWVRHYHLKNIVSTEYLGVFQPNNVYSPSGSREGIVPLAYGAVDYSSILEVIAKTEYFASIEWFGPNPAKVLREEMRWLRQQVPAQSLSLL
ncbi:sugar phosphate isomerase/epimerase [Brevibacillus laterosporus]|uniref:sugar phosphate isomerase/epimerase family protein n=1 Tax=Brevibacillus laterosporus TaxID=1465 RepID=UPI000C77518B|nr:sugar phosphate isomerase/epimerase family protein [Brevibacillus laterosporus]AUM63803.1 sugar phosphate isomerase/epimerase [Brevibacillus laterosporus]